MSDDTLFISRSSREGKGALLNKIVNELMKNCDTILATIIADWQGLSFASKLPKDVNEDEISATTLFTLEGAEGTRKELEKSLLGNKLSYLIMVTEFQKKPKYMIIFPIDSLGYIASVSHTREDMGVIIQNMKIAAYKAAQILVVPEKAGAKAEASVEHLLAPKYDQLMKKLEALKNVKLPFLETPHKKEELTQVPLPIPPTGAPPPEIPTIVAPPVSGPPTPPELPLDFIEVETEFDDLEPEIIPCPELSKFQISFKDAKGIKYTVILQALNQLDAQVQLKDRQKFNPIEIIEILKIE
ncbi:MAG: hypothetical protein HWN66_17675 [Candidatus Helarchaeota archaeon]|nr:hypothetical protein [Candidatus Helarchaeota archaeon]